MKPRSNSPYLSVLLVAALAVACGDDTSAPGADTRVDQRLTDSSVDTPTTDAIPVVPDFTCPNTCLFYVDVSQTTSGDGTSPEAAFTDVQSAIDAAYYAAGGGLCPCEVRVAEGMYTLYQQGPEDTLTLRRSMRVLGGFPTGFAGQRNPATHLTRLDGWKAGSQPSTDAGTPDAGTPDAGVNDAAPAPALRVYHVVVGSDDATLDGFTISGGYAIADQAFANPQNFGGGIYNAGASPTLRNIIFENNEAVFGGAVYNSGNAATLDRCRFFDNSALQSGGAMENRALADPTVSDSLFERNSAPRGGAVYNRAYSEPAFSGCKFTDNTAEQGGAIANDEHGDATFSSCIFNGNAVTALGGAVHSVNSSASFDTCTFDDNTAALGGAMYASGGAGLVKGSTFSNNNADHGAAFYMVSAAAPTVEASSFTKNAATNTGGAVAMANNAAPTFDGCTFAENSGSLGGAIFINHAPAVIANSILQKNVATEKGGAVYTTAAAPKLINCSLVQNSAPWGPELANESNAAPEVTNCILWGEGLRRMALIKNDATSLPKVTYSCLDGGCQKGLGCTSDNTGNVKPYTSPFANLTELRLRAGSICAEAGSNDGVAAFSLDAAGNARVVNDNAEGDATVDMGAYECQTGCACDPSSDPCCESDGRTCRFGCDAKQQCYPACNPTLNGCCASDGTIPAGVWSDETTGYCWQEPDAADPMQFAQPLYPDKGGVTYALTYCRLLNHAGFGDWRLPNVSELRSLLRYRPSTYYNPVTGERGACAIVHGCSTSCSSGACTTDDRYGDGNYLPDEIPPVSQNWTGSGASWSTYWADSRFGCTPTTEWCEAWAVDFRWGARVVVGGWSGSVAHNDNFNVRCMRK
ncbi:MAG: DUF1566 domain-containing protein [Deltaproteobacteria bacterium]|nr:DUF1566 domain-containing protein [Deltaproteobacteria bacterium]